MLFGLTLTTLGAVLVPLIACYGLEKAETGATRAHDRPDATLREYRWQSDGVGSEARATSGRHLASHFVRLEDLLEGEER